MILPWKQTLRETTGGTVSSCSGNLSKRQASKLVLNCVSIIILFGCQVLVRMRQYKEELLVSCLQLLLSLPREIVQLEISSLVPALQVSLSKTCL